ncbi:MAG: hypothetical protein R3A46_10945 [Thermomicrobiales bacterium]
MATDPRVARRRRQSRLNRALLAGMLGSLGIFLGIIVAQDAVNADAPTSISVEQVQQQESPAVRVPKPRVRTRTS